MAVLTSTKQYEPISHRIPLPHLQKLTIREYSTAEPGRTKEFMAALDIPVLSDLTLMFYKQMCFPHSGVASKLKKLKIHSAMYSRPENVASFLAFLSSTVLVEELAIKDNGLTEEFFTGLKADGDMTRLPLLRVLDIGFCFCQDEHLDETFIWDMLDSCIDRSPTEPPGVAVQTGVHFRALQKLTAPRWLFDDDGDRWVNICAAIHVECVVTTEDDDTDSESDGEEEGTVDV